MTLVKTDSLLLVVDKVNTLLDGLLEKRNGLSNVGLLSLREVARKRKDVANTSSTNFELSSKVGDTHSLVFDVGRNDDISLTVQTTDESLDEGGTSESHRKSSGTTTVLSLDDLITTELNSLDESLHLLVVELLNARNLREKRNNGSTSVTTDHRNVKSKRIDTEGVADEGLGTDGIEGCNTEDSLLIVGNVILLVDLIPKRNKRVDGVGNDTDESLRADLGAAVGEIVDDTSIHVEQIITSHTGLSGNTGGDDDDGGVLEDLGKVLGAFITLDVLAIVNVGKIASDTLGTGEIVTTEWSLGGEAYRQRS